MVEYRAQFRGTPASVRDARTVIVDYARLCGFENAALDEIALGAGEALANAVEHGCRVPGPIAVACNFVGGELTVDVTDAGPGFDIERTPAQARDPDSVRGFGISIMRAVMDGVCFERGGTTVRLLKRRQSSGVASDLREEA